MYRSLVPSKKRRHSVIRIIRFRIRFGNGVSLKIFKKKRKWIRKLEPRVRFFAKPCMKQPTIFMRNALSNIKLKCSLSGCAQVVTYDNFTTHIAQCSFNPDIEVECNHCNQLYKKRGEHQHIVGCTLFMKQTLRDHLENHSPISKDWEHIYIIECIKIYYKMYTIMG